MVATSGPESATATREIPNKDNELFREYLVGINFATLRVAAIIMALLVPFFWVLDHYIVPDDVQITLFLRLFSFLCSAAILLAMARFPDWVRRHVMLLGFGLTTQVAWTIAVLCWLHEGYESPYYAGLSLIFIGAGVLFYWPLRLGVAFAVLTYGFYMTPLLLGQIPLKDDPSVALSNQFFLLTTAAVVLTVQYFRHQLQQREFFARLNLKQTQAELEEALRQVREVDRLKSEFFNNITHELRTPLTLILGPAGSLLDDELGRLNPGQRENMRVIRQSAMQLLRLINNLLDLARLDQSFLRLQVQRTDLRELLTAIVKHSHPLAARKGVELTLFVHSTSDDLHLDLEKMERVVVNLVSNALKFTGSGGEVTVFVQTMGDEVRLSVEDSGIGIAADRLDAIFERFSQADGSITRRYGGTGIGLAFAMQIVELHGGRISVKSTPGKGSRFTVHLPTGVDHLDLDKVDRVTGDAADHGPQGGADESVEWTQELLSREEYRFLDIETATEDDSDQPTGEIERATRVLVVEDNRAMRRSIQQVLRVQHYVISAENGAMGLAVARREKPDVIVTDYMMPEMDGMAMVKQLRADPETSDIPVIMLTARNQVEARVEARSVGVDVYLGKPFHNKELRGAVNHQLEKRGRQVSVMMAEQLRHLEGIAAGLAHEMKNPLSFLKNAVVVIVETVERASSLLTDEELSLEERRNRLGKALRKVTRMQGVADRGVARLEELVELVRRYAREGYPDTPVPLELDEAVRDVGRLVVQKDGGEVVQTVALDAAGVSVHCIPEEMQQVIRNLWQNAMDAVDLKKGRVRVATFVRDGKAVLEVSDNGCGIPREDVGRIFAPFYSTKGPGGGMGVGLAIVHQTVVSAGGNISVESTVGRGSTFRVDLPISDD